MRSLPVLILVASLASSNALGQIGTASIGVGGIVITHENHISIDKEVLTISENKVVVEYDFLNGSDADITNDLAFHMPDYEPDQRPPSSQGFEDFKVWVNQVPVHYSIEVKATANGHDYTSMLRSMGIDIQSFGHKYDHNVPSQLDQLTQKQKDRLHNAGLLVMPTDGPNWAVRKTYTWSQTFPAHSTTHIRHEYTPAVGNSSFIAYATTGEASQEDSDLASVCPTPEILNALRKDAQQPRHADRIDYVDFNLTTAKTWVMPIVDFTLIADGSPASRSPGGTSTAGNLVSFCWDGPVEKGDGNQLRVHMTDFVPKKELRVGFLQSNK
jgi:hypothetical protein